MNSYTVTTTVINRYKETLAVEVSSDLSVTSFSFTTSISVDFAGVAHTNLQTNAIIVTTDTEMSY